MDARLSKLILDAATFVFVEGVIVIEDLKIAVMSKSSKGTVDNPGKLVQQ